MSTKLTVLTVKNHNRLRFEKKNDFSFARAEHHCPLLASEVYTASSSYPIVFPDGGETIIPQAMLSAIPNSNQCVAEDGSWKAGYLPLHFRRYPFFLGREKNADQAVILFDESAPHLGETHGKLLYNKRGEKFTASPLLIEIKDSLKRFDEEYQKTRALGKLLKNAKVLSPAKMTVETGGRKQKIAGFSIVDWNKVQKLDDATLANWARIGLIQLIHCHLQSLRRYGIATPAGTPDSTSPDASKKAPAKKKAKGKKTGKK
ncbi:MAG: hypothetical protein CSA52_00275 [Gammaproteobacteria bacterium]|nr:MAG: hypothetical protein CSB48_02110 [Pseudomonadota bacterium]PIE39015.1 MAG: hypothetical protein CSA52_00275 [Gammaproteobacteria bacterium]